MATPFPNWQGILSDLRSLLMQTPVPPKKPGPPVWTDRNLEFAALVAVGVVLCVLILAVTEAVNVRSKSRPPHPDDPASVQIREQEMTRRQIDQNANRLALHRIDVRHEMHNSTLHAQAQAIESIKDEEQRQQLQEQWKDVLTDLVADESIPEDAPPA